MLLATSTHKTKVSVPFLRFRNAHQTTHKRLFALILNCEVLRHTLSHNRLFNNGVFPFLWMISSKKYMIHPTINAERKHARKFNSALKNNLSDDICILILSLDNFYCQPKVPPKKKIFSVRKLHGKNFLKNKFFALFLKKFFPRVAWGKNLLIKRVLLVSLWHIFGSPEIDIRRKKIFIFKIKFSYQNIYLIICRQSQNFTNCLEFV